MKRCPQCLFLYPESDVVCDFDQTPLEIIDDAEIDRATNRSKSRSKALPVAVLIGLIVGVIGFAIYYSLSHQTRKTAAEIQPALVTQPQSLPSPAEAALASPSPTIKPSPSPSPTSQPSSNKTAHTRATSDPISTSGPGMGTRQGAKPVILLASGGKIEADEAWRTKDGVWYRRNGMVTLLKRGQVKAIVTR